MAMYLGSDQVAGVYAVVESGSNANGYYIKFEDGTMICKGTASGSSPNYDWWSFCKRTAEQIQVTFPATFVGSPTVTANPTNVLGGLFAILIDTQTTTHFTFTGLRAGGAANSNYTAWGITYIAVGRWK